ncbi:hypothetical protein Tdes44962_MAKER05664 [Teratosphaeria destructans]|uniref:Uncharacterized protein n=1 Tax=Teratosphaeria destructans TaxID=418781 RepID=A0A9W7SJ88_9PEZI|nr:hypothetical protein Tdes44962_MAKER05664 [Teratosphaeria destructans]
MLPPVEPTLLSANPRFSTLYHDLCTHDLHPDGTSKVSPDTKPRSSIEEDLRALRLATARREILQARLRGLAYGGEGQGLSGELQDLAALAAAALGTTTSPRKKTTASSDLRRRIRDAEEKLEAYGRVRGVEALGREYAEIIEEKERVGREIERLEGR